MNLSTNKTLISYQNMTFESMGFATYPHQKHVCGVFLSTYVEFVVKLSNGCVDKKTKD